MEQQTAPRIAFIGLGNMGGPMAINLSKAGHSVVAFDLASQARETTAAGGTTVATSLSECVEGASVVISMLPASKHVAQLYEGDGNSPGLLRALQAGALVIDCSTIAPDTSRRVAATARKRGFAMIDAPVSGGTAGAQNATLTFMVGGEAADVERATPLLQAMGKTILHAGNSGAGQTAKVCNNMLLAIQMIGTSEAISLGVRNGLDARVLSEIMHKSSGSNWVLDRYNPFPDVLPNVPAQRGYTGGFGTDLMLKDLELAVEAAATSRASIPLGALARSLYSIHSSSGSSGNGTLDFSSIVKLLHR